MTTRPYPLRGSWRGAGLALVGGLCALLATACSGDEEAPAEEAPADAAPAAAPEAKAEPAPKKEAPPATPVPGPPQRELGEEGEEDAIQLEYVYNPVGRRDPFKSSIGQDAAVQERRVTTPLQKYDLDQFRVVGVVWGSGDPMAMVEDPEGNGHFLKVDTLIGRNWGKVSRITANSVVVAEEYRDFQGQLMVNEIVLTLPEEQASGSQ